MLQFNNVQRIVHVTTLYPESQFMSMTNTTPVILQHHIFIEMVFIEI